MPLEPQIERITDLSKILYWMNELMDVSGAFAILEDAACMPEPVVVKRLEAKNKFELDVNSSPNIKIALTEGNKIMLQGFKRGAKIVTAPILPISSPNIFDKNRCQFNIPDFIDVEFRRENYRATLRQNMIVQVILTKLDSIKEGAGEIIIEGTLRDLAVSGCGVRVPAASASYLGKKNAEFELNIIFPNEMNCQIVGKFSYFQFRGDDGVDLGIEFLPLSVEKEKRLMYFVREIERESARGTLEKLDLSPSSLFLSISADSARLSVAENTPVSNNSTPERRKLERIASFLEAQALSIQHERQIDGGLLSKNADRLLGLQKQDSQELLFSLLCLDGYSDVVSHCIAVAARLVDIGASLRIPVNQLKAVAASAMIHDFTTYLMASRNQGNLTNSEDIPGLLYSRIDNGGWLSREIFQEVVGEIGEQADGVKYSSRVVEHRISELGKLAIVVDQIDVLQRGGEQGKKLSLAETKSYLSRNSDAIDPKWSRYYFTHFGNYPVGSYVIFSDQTRGWVRRVDSSNKPVAIVRTETEVIPLLSLDTELSGSDLFRLGEPMSVHCVA